MILGFDEEGKLVALEGMGCLEEGAIKDTGRPANEKRDIVEALLKRGGGNLT